MEFPSGQIREEDGSYTLRFERQLPFPLPRVWDALTQPAYLAKWIAEATVDLSVGGVFILDFVHDPSVMRGSITRLREYSLLEYTWNEGGNPPSTVCWELFPQGPDACLLVLTHSGLRRDVPSLGAGWHTHIDLMVQVLSGERRDFSWEDEWWRSKVPLYGTGS